MENARIVFIQKEKLARKIEILADYAGSPNRRHLPNALLMKTISNFACEKRIMHMIDNNDLVWENRKFDAYFRQKSAFATVKILDRVKTALSTFGQEATIFTEVSADSARYDAVVTPGKLGEVNAWDSRNVRIEIKASLGLDLEQLGRYLWNRSPLILVRVITGHVAKIYPSEVQSYVTFSLEELGSKVDRLLSQKCYAAPGIDCEGCPNIKCVYWRERSRKRKIKNVVTLPDTEFGEDLTLFFQNLGYVAERTAMMVVEELKGYAQALKQTGETLTRRSLDQFQAQKT